MAEKDNTDSDILIQAEERGPVDNRTEVTTDPSQKTSNQPNPKKRRHTRKHGPSKAKRPKGKEAEGSDDDQSAPPAQVFFPPEVLAALKHSLREDIMDICEQTVKAVLSFRLILNLQCIFSAPSFKTQVTASSED